MRFIVLFTVFIFCSITASLAKKKPRTGKEALFGKEAPIRLHLMNKRGLFFIW